MTNFQLFIAIVVPTMAVLVNMALGQRWFSELRAEQNDLRKEVTKELAEVRVAIANLRAELYEKFELRKSHV
jgi:hypothetical protein